MLTCFESPTDLFFQRILGFFVRPDSIVLDLTYGRGLCWKNIFSKYRVIKIDKRKFFPEIIQIDFKEYLKKSKDLQIDCVYYDPPYYFREKIKSFNIQNQLLNYSAEVFWTQEEFEESLQVIKEHVPRILKEGGIFIIKIMDGYIGKTYYPNAFRIFQELNTKLKPIGIFICPIQKKSNVPQFIRTNHIYYLVFMKKS